MMGREREPHQHESKVENGKDETQIGQLESKFIQRELQLTARQRKRKKSNFKCNSTPPLLPASNDQTLLAATVQSHAAAPSASVTSSADRRASPFPKAPPVAEICN